MASSTSDCQSDPPQVPATKMGILWQEQASDFPRLNDLNLASDHGRPNNYFDYVQRELVDSSVRPYFLKLEGELQQLDESAWKDLRQKIIPYVHIRDPLAHWRQLFDHLNEAKGNLFLKDQGYTDIRFIPVSPKDERRTPDLEAYRKNSAALLDVKTINESQEQLEYLSTPPTRYREARSVVSGLTGKLKTKIEKTTESAKQQLLEYRKDLDARRIILCVIRLDIDLALAGSNYAAVEEFLRQMNQKDPRIEIAHHFVGYP